MPADDLVGRLADHGMLDELRERGSARDDYRRAIASLPVLSARKGRAI
jgi:hypothetical protein